MGTIPLAQPIHVFMEDFKCLIEMEPKSLTSRLHLTSLILSKLRDIPLRLWHAQMYTQIQPGQVRKLLFL